MADCATLPQAGATAIFRVTLRVNLFLRRVHKYAQVKRHTYSSPVRRVDRGTPLPLRYRATRVNPHRWDMDAPVWMRLDTGRPGVSRFCT